MKGCVAGLIVIGLLGLLRPEAASPQAISPLRVGWVGPLSGATVKYGAKEAALVAMDEINAAGGINGRPLKLVMEDGRCDGGASASAIHKLIEADGLRVIIGGGTAAERR